MLIGSGAQRARRRGASDGNETLYYSLIPEASNNILACIHHTLRVTPAFEGGGHRSGPDNRKRQTLCLTGKSIRRHQSQ